MRPKGWVDAYDFLIIPPPQPDELLSSWLTRLAFAHGYSLTTFISLFLRHDGSALSRRDLDFKEEPQLLEKLAQKSGLAYDELFQMSLRSEEGYLFESDHGLYPPNQIRKLKDRRTHDGLMFCPICLSEDTHPYWRKQWRYRFYNACTRHRVFLTDRCGKCYERVRFHKMKPLDALVYCSKCGRDLRKTVARKVPSTHFGGIDAIEWLEEGLRHGYFTIGPMRIRSLFVFHVYTILSWLLDRGEGLQLHGFPMLEDYKRLCRKERHYRSPKARSIDKDFYLTAMVYHLFQDYHENLKCFAVNNQLTHRNFTHGFNHAPCWYKTMIDECVPMHDTVGREISESEVVGAIKYLKSIGKHVTKVRVAEIVGCHPSIHKQFVGIYKICAETFKSNATF